jgi:hypothetical protein
MTARKPRLETEPTKRAARGKRIAAKEPPAVPSRTPNGRRTGIPADIKAWVLKRDLAGMTAWDLLVMLDRIRKEKLA